MGIDRREFLKVVGGAGMGLAAAGNRSEAFPVNTVGDRAAQANPLHTRHRTVIRVVVRSCPLIQLSSSLSGIILRKRIGRKSVEIAHVL